MWLKMEATMLVARVILPMLRLSLLSIRTIFRASNMVIPLVTAIIEEALRKGTTPVVIGAIGERVSKEGTSLWAEKRVIILLR